MVFSVYCDPIRTTIVGSVQHGAVQVDPAKPGLATVNVPADKEVEVMETSVNPIAAIGGVAGAAASIGSRRATSR